MNKKDLSKLFFMIVCLFYTFNSSYSEDEIIEDLQNILKNPDIEFCALSLLDIPKENRNTFCDYKFVKKRNGKEWLKKAAESNKMVSDYSSVGSFLEKFSIEIGFSKKSKISNNIAIPLIKSIIKSTPKRVVQFSHNKKNYVEPWQYDVAPRMTNNIAEGVLLILYHSKTPVYAFDIKNPKQAILPFHYNSTPGRFYKLYLDDKKRLYMFDSFIFFPNNKAKEMMTELWKKLNVVAYLSENTDLKLSKGYANSIFAGLFKYVPKEALNKRPFYKVNDLTFKFYITWIKHIELKKQSNIKKLIELGKKLNDNNDSKDIRAQIKEIEKEVKYYDLSIKKINEEFNSVKKLIKFTKNETKPERAGAGINLDSFIFS